MTLGRKDGERTQTAKRPVGLRLSYRDPKVVFEDQAIDAFFRRLALEAAQKDHDSFTTLARAMKNKE